MRHASLHFTSLHFTSRFALLRKQLLTTYAFPTKIKRGWRRYELALATRSVIVVPRSEAKRFVRLVRSDQQAVACRDYPVCERRPTPLYLRVAKASS